MRPFTEYSPKADRMNKKHLINCLMLLVLISSAKLLFDSSSRKSLNTKVLLHQDSFSEINTTRNFISTKPEKDVRINYTFANEALPSDDPGILSRMKTALKNYSFHNMQTTHLHTNAAKWFPVVVPILRAYGIPEDFKYVPLVESGFEPGSSVKGASGYWQFMPATARGYGLKVNDKIDERHNVRKSTIAACRYIKSLYKEFGSWTLAAAAYNIGGNSLKRHMANQNEDNYYRMKLNRETASYVYRLISMKEIIERPRLYGYYHKDAKFLAQSKAPGKRLLDPLIERQTLMVFPMLIN